MDAKRLQEIKARCEAVKPGPWYWIPSEDAEFIIHAHQDIPDMIAEIERLQELFDRAMELVCKYAPSAKNMLVDNAGLEIELPDSEEVKRLQQEWDHGEIPDPRAGATGATVANYRIIGESMGDHEWNGEGGA